MREPHLLLLFLNNLIFCPNIPFSLYWEKQKNLAIKKLVVTFYMRQDTACFQQFVKISPLAGV